MELVIAVLIILVLVAVVLYYRRSLVALGRLFQTNASYPVCHGKDWTKIQGSHVHFPNYDPNTAVAKDPTEQSELARVLSYKSTPAQCGNWCIYDPYSNKSFSWDPNVKKWAVDTTVCPTLALSRDASTGKQYAIDLAGPFVENNEPYKPHFF